MVEGDWRILPLVEVEVLRTSFFVPVSATVVIRRSIGFWGPIRLEKVRADIHQYTALGSIGPTKGYRSHGQRRDLSSVSVVCP
jgi:hypothetical protein